jgi:hypothetical protein
LYFFHKGKFDILVVPEPYYQNAKKAEINASICFRDHRIRLFPTKYTSVYLNIDTLGSAYLHHESVHDGRAQFFVFRTGENTYHIVIAAYGYQSGINPDKDKRPRDLYHDVLQTHERLVAKYPGAECYMLGDLQATVHRDETDDLDLHRIGKPPPRRDFNLYDFSRKLIIRLRRKKLYMYMYMYNYFLRKRIEAPQHSVSERHVSYYVHAGACT